MAEPDLFKGIKKDHVLEAIDRINEEGYPPMRRSTSYDLVYQNITYPPKYVLSLAGYFRNSEFISHHLFAGGENSAAFEYLNSLGFTIQPKTETRGFSKARENPAVHKKYINEEDIMERPDFFSEKDFKLLAKYAGQRLDRSVRAQAEAYDYLKDTYQKVEYWTQEVQKRCFPEGVYSIIKKPTNQASKFEEYLWAKIYPTEQLQEWKSLAYTTTISNREDFCVKIDTVALGDNDPLRKQYLNYRGDFFSSPIVKIFKADEILKANWEVLINKSVDAINSLKTDYSKLLPLLGYTSNKNLRTPPLEKIGIALNTILYGPPGTGKTYELNLLKVKHFTDTDISKSKPELLRELLEPYPFWQVLGAALQSAKKPLAVGELIEHPIIKARVNPAIKTKPNNIAWADLQSYADDESTQLASKYRRSIKLFHKDKEGKWSIAENQKKELPDIIDQNLLDLALNPEGIKPVPAARETRRYNFITFHQKYGYEDFIEGIKPILKNRDEKVIDQIKDSSSQLAFELKKGIFFTSCLEALRLAGYHSFEDCYQDSKVNRTTKFGAAKGIRENQFALFIDEINRANISAVFGELITLIEENKRLGQEEEMWLHLPYSNESFGVPPNLFLIGSMNTADRSIALLDIALRRRFEFVGIYPKYDTIPAWAPMLKDINRKIFEIKKNPDFFVGHAFFINQSTSRKADIFNKKIIPLLMEYFQNNIATVKAVLDVAQIKVKETSIENNHQLIAEE